MNIKTLYKIIRLIIKTKNDMKNISNIKDKLSTICGAIIFLCGPGTGLLWTLGVPLPKWLIAIAVAFAGIAGYVITYLIGKNPDGSTKTPTQVNALNTESANTKEFKP